MRYFFFYIFVVLSFISYSQTSDLNLGDFKLSNVTSPAFLLLEESPTEIYTPDNLKPLTIHALNNFNGNLSIEFVPYFFTNVRNRTYFKYVGVYDGDNQYDITNNNPNVKQKPFSGILRTLSVSGAYTDKEFSGIGESRKVYSIGVRTTILRFFDKNKIYWDALSLSDKLSQIDRPVELMAKRRAAKTNGDKDLEDFYQNAITSYYKEKEETILKPFLKTVKPIFKVDGAIAYSALFTENKVSSGTANRFGSWLIADVSIILNEGDTNRKANNYFSLFALGRYIEDEFNLTEDNSLRTLFYRDVGGKVQLDLGKLSFSYEYISRNGSVNSKRSVGNIKYTISKDITLMGGFGKNFNLEDNLVTLFGINWGLNVTNSSVKIK